MQDFITQYTVDGKNASAPLLAHLRRKLLHAIWGILLDEELIAAYEHGTVVECGDGVTRRVYIRLFTYSADYPEK